MSYPDAPKRAKQKAALEAKGKHKRGQKSKPAATAANEPSEAAKLP